MTLHNFRTSYNLPGPPSLARFMICLLSIIIFWSKTCLGKVPILWVKINITSFYSRWCMKMLNCRKNTRLSWNVSHLLHFSFWLHCRMAFSHSFEYRQSHVKMANETEGVSLLVSFERKWSWRHRSAWISEWPGEPDSSRRLNAGCVAWGVTSQRCGVFVAMALSSPFCLINTSLSISSLAFTFCISFLSIVYFFPT